MPRRRGPTGDCAYNRIGSTVVAYALNSSRRLGMNLVLLVLHVTVGLLFFAHGAQKVFGWFGGYGIGGTAGFMESLGMRPGRLHAWAAGIAETVGGILLALGVFTPIGAAMVIAVMVTAIITVHGTKKLLHPGRRLRVQPDPHRGRLHARGRRAGRVVAGQRVRHLLDRHRLGPRRARRRPRGRHRSGRAGSRGLAEPGRPGAGDSGLRGCRRRRARVRLPRAGRPPQVGPRPTAECFH